MKIALVALIGLLLVLNCLGQDDEYPIPPIQDGHLFYVQHSRNKNTVMYETNMLDNKLNVNDPVKVYWIRYSERGQTEKLNAVQQKFAYGIKTMLLNDQSFQLSFVSNKKFKMTLQRSESGDYRVFANINGKPAVLQRIFIKIIGGSPVSPKIDYVDLFGVDPTTNSDTFQRVKM